MIIDSPVISGSLQSSGSLVQVGNTVISGSLVVTSGITGSFQGTSSFASSASYSVSSSYAVSASAAVNAETLDGLDSTVFVLTGSFNSTSASLDDRTTKLEATASYLNNASASLNDKVTSLESTASILTSASASLSTTSGSLNDKVTSLQATASILVAASASLSTTSGSLNAGLVNVIQTTASFATTGSNVFTGKQQVSDVTNPISFTSSASLYVDGGMRVLQDAYISGTLYLNNLIVYGTQSVNYITSSQLNIGTNIITLNTDVPNIRFGGISVYDSGSTNLSGSILWDSEANHWVYSNPSGSTYDGGMLIAGPKNSSGLGNEQGINCNAIVKGQGGDHITSSAIFDYGNATCFYGGASTIAANTISTLQISATGVTASLEGTASHAISSSFAITASYALNAGAGAGFPYSGSAVITGSLQITNLTGSGVRYLVADESGSITAQTASAVIKTTQEYTATAGQTVFAVSGGYSTGYVDVFINGTKLNSSEFTDTSGTNIVLTTGSFLDDVVEVVKYLPASGVSNNVLRQLTTFTASAGQTSFTVDYTPGLLDVFYNGARLTPVEYTANNGTSITLATASLQGDVLDIMVYSYQVGAFSGIGGQGVANQVSYYSTTNSITGSNTLTFDGSTLSLTGSLIVTSSGTFTNIGPAVFSGSVVVTGSMVVSGSIITTGGITISGSIASASYALSASNADLLDGLDSTVFTLTSSFNAASSSLDAGLKNVIARTGSFATTGSNVFYGNQTVSASMFVSGSVTATGQIVAQTINVQSVTSSIVYSSGSNVFGNDISNTQTFTGSMLITGSVRATGAICTTGTVCAAIVCSPTYLGGTVSGTTIYGSTAICGGVICGGATTLTGALSGTSATFSSFVQAGTNFISVPNTDSISVGTSTAENAKYNYLGHSGYWGLKTTTTGFNFAIDTYNGGTPKNVLTITQAGAATFSSTLETGGDITVSKSGDSGININSTTTNGVAVTRYKTTAAGNLWATGINITAGDSRWEVYNFTSGVSPFRLSNSTGAATFSSNVNDHSIRVQNSNTSGYSSIDLIDSAGTEKLILGWGNSGLSSLASKAFLYTTSGVDLNFYTGGSTTAKMIIQSGGNVGIGATTVNSRFHIFQTGQPDISCALYATQILQTDSQANYQRIRFDRDSCPFWGVGVEGASSTNDFIISGLIGGKTSGTWSDNVFRIKNSNGYVGIGTASPNYQLQINSSTSISRIQLTNTSTGTASGDGFQVIADGVNSTLSLPETGYMSFETSNTERMRITSGGSVCIGTAAVSGEILRVTGCSCLDNYISVYSGTIQVFLDADKTFNQGIVGTQSGHALSLRTSGTNRLTISTAGVLDFPGSNSTATSASDTLSFGVSSTTYAWIQSWGGRPLRINELGNNVNAYGTNGYGLVNTTASDVRIKKNIISIENALDKVNCLRGVYYEFNENNCMCMKVPSGKRRVGLIAQEVACILPEALLDSEDSSVPISLDYSGMVGLLTKAIQEQQCQICTQSTIINQLKTCLGIS